MRSSRRYRPLRVAQIALALALALLPPPQAVWAQAWPRSGSLASVQRAHTNGDPEKALVVNQSYPPGAPPSRRQMLDAKLVASGSAVTATDAAGTAALPGSYGAISGDTFGGQPLPSGSRRSLRTRDDAAGTGGTTGDYAARIAAALAAARQAQGTAGAARIGDLARASAALPPTLIVRAGGADIHPDLGAIRDDLRAADHDSGRLRDAVVRLQALRAALAAPSALPAAPDSRRLAALDDMLRKPPFTSPPSFWGYIGDLIARSPLGAALDAARRLLGAIFGASAQPALDAAPYIAGFIVAVAAVYVANRLLHPFVPHVDAADDEGAGGRAARLDAMGARERATTLAGQGAYREAVRYIFLATLLTLDENGTLHIDAATSNRDILRQARATPPLAEALIPVVRLFDLFLFGHAPVTREDYERYRRLNEQALRAAR